MNQHFVEKLRYQYEPFIPHAHVKVDAVVVGASWAGIWTLHLLKQRGLNVIVVDDQKEVGGSWSYTRYPGSRVDAEVPLYEFSMPDLWKNWNWSERFPSQKEILQYLSWVCDYLHLKENIVLNTRVQSAIWNEHTCSWRVSCNNGTIYDTKYFIGCSGFGTVKHIPTVPGLENFRNKYHTSEWPEGLDLSDKRVGIIGTGSSGLQIIEQLGPVVKHLTVFQKTPNLATPARQRTFTPQEMQKWKEENYTRHFKSRFSQTGFHTCSNRNTDKSSDERRKFYEDLWTRGGLAPWLGNYADLLSSRKSNQYMYEFWREKVLEKVKDPVTAEKLAPKNPPHAFGTKRPSLETTYFDTFNLPNVDLVDINEDPIREATPLGLQTCSEFHSLDVIILATGFDCVVGSMLAMDIRGVEGIPLKNQWDTTPEGLGVRTYLGLMSSGFPNMFFLMGPHSPAGLGFTPHICEIQGAWVTECISYMLTNRYTRVEPSIEAEKKWTLHVNEGSQRSLMAETNSWFNGANLPNRRKQPLCYFGRIDEYSERLTKDSRNAHPLLHFKKKSWDYHRMEIIMDAWLRLNSWLSRGLISYNLRPAFLV